MLVVVISLTDDHQLARRDHDQILAAIAESAEGIGGQDPKIANSWENRNAVARFPAETQIRDGGVAVSLKPAGFTAVRVGTGAR